MAIPAIPTNFNVQTANEQVYLSWDLSAGATSYSVERSTDGITFAVIASPVTPELLDITASLATKYYYRVSSVNGSGTSPASAPQAAIPVPTGEQSLGQLRLNAQRKADRVGSNFVTLPEWNQFINLAVQELYDMLITAYEDYFVAAPVTFTSDGTTSAYPLPANFYKLMGVDLAVNPVANAWVSVKKFTFMDRNKYVYPNTASTIYGVFNLQYRLLGSNIQFIPTPSAGQSMRLWFIPRVTELLKDTDTTTVGISGWCQWIICRAAKYALDKEESDTSKIDAELLFLKQRIEESAVNRDAGQPDTITDVRGSGWGYGGGNGSFGPTGGF